MRTPALPKHIRIFFVFFFIANLTHFIHNAEYIAFYPGLPVWLTREKIYLAWAAGVSLGLAGLMLVRFRLKLPGMVLVAAYGATGFDGLAHYTLDLCSEHTLATNLTIWFEVLTGVTLLVASSLWIPKTVSLRSVKNWLP